MLYFSRSTVCVQQSKKSTNLLSLVNIPSCFCKSCQLVLGMHYSSSFPVIQNCYCQRTPSCASSATSTWTEHHVNTSLYLRILADHVHPFITTLFHLPMAASSRIICRVAKLESCQTAFFLEHGEEFTVLQWPPPDISSVEHLWDMAEQEICNRQTAAKCVKKSRRSEEYFHHFVEAIPLRMRAVLKPEEAHSHPSKVYLIKSPLNAYASA